MLFRSKKRVHMQMVRVRMEPSKGRSNPSMLNPPSVPGRRVYSNVLPVYAYRRRPTLEPDTLNATPLRLGALTLSINILH